jgi:hypothetical protein
MYPIEYKCTREDTPVIIQSITIVRVSKRKPHSASKASAKTQCPRLRLQGDPAYPTS